MIWSVDIDNWWNHQERFKVMCTSTNNPTIKLLDSVNSIIVEESFNSVQDAKEFAFDLFHGRLARDLDNTTLDIVMFLRRQEHLITRQMGNPEMNERRKAMLTMMLEVTRLALEREMWINGGAE